MAKKHDVREYFGIGRKRSQMKRVDFLETQNFSKIKTGKFFTLKEMAVKARLTVAEVMEAMKEKEIPYFFTRIDGVRTRIYCVE